VLVKNYFNPPQHWIKPCWGLLFILFLSITVFFETWSSIVEIWIRSKTFNHGFVIAPISAWLISSRRNFYSQLYPTFSYGALFAVLFGGLLWLVANLSHVLVVKQFAVVGVLVSGFWAILGNRVAFNMLFPLSFLFFMVPVGEELIPLLREFTSTFTVNLIRLTGLPVYR
jgi:exosortase